MIFINFQFKFIYRMKKIVTYYILIFLIVSYSSSFSQDNTTLSLNIGKFNPEISNFPPFFINSPDEKEFSDLIFSTLIEKTDDGKLVNNLVKSITETQNNEWILILKDNLKFHNNSNLTSEDVKFSFEIFNKIKNEKNCFYYYELNKIKEIEIIENRTLIIKLTSDIKDFKYILSKVSIVPKNVYEKDTIERTIKALKEDKPVGSGPFILESLTPQLIKLSAFKDYHLGKTDIDTICIYEYNSYDKLLQDFYIGKIDYFEVPNFKIAAELGKTGLKNYKIYRKNRSLIKFYFLAFNTSKPLFQNKTIRSCLKYAINKNEIINNISNNKTVKNVESAFSFVPLHSPLFLNDLEEFKFEPGKTLKILKQNGWDTRYVDRIIQFKDRKFVFDISIPKSILNFEDAIRIIRLNLNEIRIGANIRPLPFSVFNEKMDRKDYSMALYYSFYFDDSMYNTLKSLFSPENGNFNKNIFNLNNQEIFKNIERLKIIEDFNLKIPIFERIQMLVEAESPFIPLFFDTTIYYAFKTDKFKKQSLTFDKWEKK